MAIDLKDFIKDIKNSAGMVKRSYKDAGKNIIALKKNYDYVKASKKKTKKMREKGIINYAQKKYKKKYGKEMLPSVLKAELEGGMLSKGTKEYLNWKEEARKRFKRVVN